MKLINIPFKFISVYISQNLPFLLYINFIWESCASAFREVQSPTAGRDLATCINLK